MQYQSGGAWSAAARAYSIASTQSALSLLELMVRLMPHGKTSHWLEHNAKVGDRVKLQAPLGSFGLDERAHRYGNLRAGTAVSLLVQNDFDAHTAYYLCRPPAMVNARTTLTGFGVAPKAIRAERFQRGG